ncbi:MAG TPA: bifunctional glutamate N-acetyltransferase/amino-acid acetyltransferase ArgJ [Thermoplasmata archaeon]|nr:bifunctional glutamate N-acetyltransferase/amino-acid acetyltransferase ArgJ [Thermoplasmata archaeon]
MNDGARLPGGITSPKGFLAGGVAAGVKRSGRPDLAIVLSDREASAAGVFTTNLVKAAPVLLGMEAIRDRPNAVRGILTVSGTANALTGAEGLDDNRQVLAAAEGEFGLPAGSLLPACTGVIGTRIPVDRVVRALPSLHGSVASGPEGGEPAAHAILTTDTRTKQAAVRVRLRDGVVVRVGGMAKGSGMIAPRLAPPHATALAYLTTDATASPKGLATILERGVESSFNMITVDGDTSTNDTVYLLANGAAGGESADRDPAFIEAVDTVLRSLARQVARDGEGATKLLSVTVAGARSLSEARAAARAVAGSMLVKAALFGADPNVGRIAAALGHSGARLDPERLDISLERPRGAIPLITDGRPARALDNGAGMRIRDLLRQLDEVPITVRLHEGKAHATAWGCDLSYAYVQINAAYRT